MNDNESYVTQSTDMDDYPVEALPMGTYVRSISHNRLGIIVDAFYGENDEVGTKIIIYTVLLSPDTDSYNRFIDNTEPYYLSNEYEYDIIAYLMIGPAEIPHLKRSINGELYI
tara:strand:+ start:125 stop:463 length:339 start_codon:yes stop_codon:yes gene_type:complete